jgi:hypothetical protein
MKVRFIINPQRDDPEESMTDKQEMAREAWAQFRGQPPTTYEVEWLAALLSRVEARAREEDARICEALNCAEAIRARARIKKGEKG